MKVLTFEESLKRFEVSWQANIEQKIIEAEKALKKGCKPDEKLILIEYIDLLKKEKSISVVSDEFSNNESKRQVQLEEILIKNNILTYNIIDTPEENNGIFSTIKSSIRNWLSTEKYY